MILPKDNEYIIVGDVHGCIDELKLLLKQQGFQTNEQGLLKVTSENDHKSIILLGDFIDKASEEKLTETIEFIYHNYWHLNQKRKRFYLVLGNHEEMVYRYLKKDPTLVITPKTIRNKAKYYNTVALLEKNQKLKEYFLEMYDECSVWYKYIHTNDFSITLTHAPCPEKYLTQESKEAQRKMVKCVSRSKNPTTPLDELIDYTHKEAKDNQHYHIFGHLSQPSIRQFKNKICIDTSAIYGNTLSCAIITKDILTFDSVIFQNKQKASTQTYNTLFDFDTNES
jgi:predicted phosphodiesterase